MELEDKIVFNIDVMLARRKMSVTELSERVGITLANMSILKNGKAKAIRISTLAKLCEALDCQPGDLLEYRDNSQSKRAALKGRSLLSHHLRDLLCHERRGAKRLLQRITA